MIYIENFKEVNIDMLKCVLFSVVCLGMVAAQGHAISLAELTENTKYVEVSEQLEIGAAYIDTISLVAQPVVVDKTAISVTTYELVPENTVITMNQGQVFGPAIVEDKTIIQYDERNSIANLTHQQMSPRDLVNMKASNSGISVLFGRKFVFEADGDLQRVFEKQGNEYQPIGMDSTYYSIALNIYE